MDCFMRISHAANLEDATHLEELPWTQHDLLTYMHYLPNIFVRYKLLFRSFSIYSKTLLSETLTKWDTSLWDVFGLSGIFFYHFIVMKTSLSGTLNKWNTSLSRTLFSVPKPKMNLTKWDTLLFETSPGDAFITFQGKSGWLFLQKLGIIKPMSQIVRKNQ